jgi:aspartokinase
MFGIARNDGHLQSSDLVVWKFGGTSIADRPWLRRVAERLGRTSRRGTKVVAVLSAMGDATDRLVRLAYDYSAVPQPREVDALVSLAECASCALAAMAIHELGAHAVSLTGPQAGRHHHRRLARRRPAHRDPPATRTRRTRSRVDPSSSWLPRRSPAGDVTTLGRGSDTSAVALAPALGLRSCGVFSDVAGVFTADLRVVPEARAMPRLSHGEMLELGHGGAAVLAPRCVELAQTHDIDSHVRSTFTAGGGTWIQKEHFMLEDPGSSGWRIDVTSLSTQCEAGLRLRSPVHWPDVGSGSERCCAMARRFASRHPASASLRLRARSKPSALASMPQRPRYGDACGGRCRQPARSCRPRVRRPRRAWH